MKTVKELYLSGMMTERTHTMIHKIMGSQHNFKLYDDVEWTSMQELLDSGKFTGNLRSKIAAMATL